MPTTPPGCDWRAHVRAGTAAAHLPDARAGTAAAQLPWPCNALMHALQVETTFEANATFREDVEETDPFGETYTQNCPFTPFKVSVALLNDEPGACYVSSWRRARFLRAFFLRHNHCCSSTLFPCPPSPSQWAEVFVDGKRAQHFVLHGPSSTKTFVGFAQNMGHRGGEKAFCFSMPRPVFEVAGQSSIEPEQDPEKLADIGSVRIDLHRTSFLRREDKDLHGAGVDFDPTDKKTAKRVGSSAAVRAGATPHFSLPAKLNVCPSLQALCTTHAPKQK